MLSQPVDEAQTDIPVEDQTFFNQFGNNSLRTVMKGDELVQYDSCSAAYDSGYGFVDSYRVLNENPHSEQIMHLLGLWEKARMAGAFTDPEKERMKDLDREFHLEHSAEGKWVLTEQ